MKDQDMEHMVFRKYMTLIGASREVYHTLDRDVYNYKKYTDLVTWATYAIHLT